MTGQEVFAEKPLLAHYTTVQTLEKMLLSKEVWFSNPLFMNDFEEVRFGLIESERIISTDSAVLDACGTVERRVELLRHMNFYSQRFINEHLFDTYIFCLSEHTRGDADGLLSMWRGYGANGNGVAVVFDTSKLTTNPKSPLLIAKVAYASADARRDWIVKATAAFCGLLKGLSLPTEKLHLAAFALFERIKLFALFSKHKGFDEEREWRIAYLSDRDHANIFAPFLNYALGNSGIQPKLRFKIAPIDGFSSPDLSFDKIVHSILLGPSIGSPIAKATIMRMLDVCGEPTLKNRILSSSIPFRQT
jgi:hypothetical protein